MNRTIIAILASCSAVAGIAAAETPQGVPPAKRHPELAAKLDANGDGRVSREEFIAGMEKREAWIKANKPELYKKLDVDGDGNLTGKDRQVLHERWQQNHPELKDRLDRNDDGKVGVGERRAADRAEDRRDRREDARDRAEDKRDAAHDGGLLDDLEDALDHREDVRDRREDRRDHAPGPVGGAGRR
jgi:hypothetical protein